MIKRQEELGDIKYQSTCLNILCPTRSNNICKKHVYVRGRLLFKSFKLMRIYEVVGDGVKLNSFSDYFLNQFTEHI